MAREANLVEIQLVFPQADLVQGSAWTSQGKSKGNIFAIIYSEEKLQWIRRDDDGNWRWCQQF